MRVTKEAGTRARFFVSTVLRPGARLPTNLIANRSGVVEGASVGGLNKMWSSSSRRKRSTCIIYLSRVRSFWCVNEESGFQVQVVVMYQNAITCQRLRDSVVVGA